MLPIIVTIIVIAAIAYLALRKPALPKAPEIEEPVPPRPPGEPSVYICPRCSKVFLTDKELEVHMLAEECPVPAPIPIPTVPVTAYTFDVAYEIERECEEGYMEGGRWVCTKYFPEERILHIKVTNRTIRDGGAIEARNVKIDAILWLKIYGDEHQILKTISIVDNFAANQTKTYSKGYMRPITGMNPSYRLYIKIIDPDGQLAVNKVIDLPYI